MDERSGFTAYVLVYCAAVGRGGRLETITSSRGEVRSCQRVERGGQLQDVVAAQQDSILGKNFRDKRIPEFSSWVGFIHQPVEVVGAVI